MDMKINKFSISILILSMITVGCQHRDQTNNNQENNQLITITLKNQLMAGSDEEYSYADYSEKDLQALVQYENQLLKSRGYQKLNIQAFNNKVKEVFGRIIDNQSSSEFLKIDPLEQCNKKFLFEPLSESAQYIYVSKEQQFITYFLPLPLIIDYQKEYPDMSEIEDKKITIHDDIENADIEVTHWKEVPNIQQKRFHNIRTLVSRNKYLFNDSKADLAWLLQNDKKFLENLLVIFGYDKEDKINEMVLNDKYKEYSEQIPIVKEKIADLFFTKDCDGKLIIRKGLLDYVRKKTTATDNRYIYALSTYMDILYTGDEDKAFDYDPTTRFTETEKAEIVTNIASIENPAFRKYQMEEGAEAWVRGYNAATGLYNLSVDYPKIISIIKENNYFNIPNMKQVIEDLPEEAPPIPGDEE